MYNPLKPEMPMARVAACTCRSPFVQRRFRRRGRDDGLFPFDARKPFYLLMNIFLTFSYRISKIMYIFAACFGTSAFDCSFFN